MGITVENSESSNAAEEVPHEEKITNTDKDQERTADNTGADKTDKKETEQNTLNQAELSKSVVELLKWKSYVLSNSNAIPNNFTINQYFGDCLTGDAQKIDFGENNEFDSVSIENRSHKNKVVLHKTTKINFSDDADIYRYLKENQQTPYCSFLIALSIFDNCEFNLVSKEAEVLYEMLSEEHRVIINEAGEQEMIGREHFEVSRQELAEFFGLQFYQNYLVSYGGKIRTGFVKFASETIAEKVLRCIFMEFISLRNKINGYLTKLICSEKLSLYAAAINAVKKVCIIDPEYFISGIVTRLLANKSIPSDIAVAEIICTIASYSNSAYSADNFLKVVYDKDRNVHYHIIMLLMCKNLEYNVEKTAKLMRPILWELIEQPKLEVILKQVNVELPEEEDFINHIGAFYNIGERYADYYIAIVSELYDILMKLTRSDVRREYVRLTFLLFVKEDYKASCLNTNDPKKFKDMIFIRLVLREKKTADKLIYLWAEILSSHKFSSIAKKQLKNYLCVRGQTSLEEKAYKRIEIFFMNLVRIERIRNSVIYLIKNLAINPKEQNIIARRIYKTIGGTGYEQ